ncbi:hypothetical protein C8Q79DRAFT_634809 [Trametes meyenii]|nr:hypothetical protein C8Q79DRAFT_634809 [Trametes meyenii]
MALPPFLSCISSLTRLTKLELANCFVPPASRGSRAGAPAPYAPKHLKKVTIEDYPCNISAVLSAFVLPTSCDVSLTGNLRGVSREQCRFAYGTMLPPDRRCLPILRSVSSLIVTLDSRAAQYEFYAETASGVAISLDIILRSPPVARDHSLLGDPEGILDNPAHGRFFEQMVSRMPRELFPDAPIQSARFLGNVGAVPYQSWVSALAQFPALKKLEVDDMTLYNHLRDVVAALRTASPMSPPGPVCPLLEEIELFGDGGQQLDVQELDSVRDCLAWRKAHGGQAVLKNFRIGLFYKAGQASERSERVERIERAFEPFTRRFTFEIYVQPGRRMRDE